jgi:dTDP-4-amino-4,6-dideoxygalactose transaminase
MQDLGYNYRITDLQSALGRSQLKRLPEFITRRQEIASCYNQAFANIDWLKTPALSSSSPTTRYPLPVASAASNTLDPRLSTLDSSFSYQLSDISLHLYTVQIDFPRLGKTRTEVMQELREKGVGTQVLYIPVYLQPWYRRTYGYASGKCPNAEEFYSRALSLPLYPAMSDADVEKVIQAVKNALVFEKLKAKMLLTKVE